MKTSYPRLGKKVKLKGGATLHVLDGGSPEVTEPFSKSAVDIAEMTPDMAGYAIVAWGFDGRYVRAFHCHAKGPVSATMMPSYVKDVLLREVTESSVYETLTEGEV